MLLAKVKLAAGAALPLAGGRRDGDDVRGGARPACPGDRAASSKVQTSDAEGADSSQTGRGRAGAFNGDLTPPRLNRRLSSSPPSDESSRPRAGPSPAQLFSSASGQGNIATGIKQEESEKLYRGQEIPDILASGKTDQEGRFRFQDVPCADVPSQCVRGRNQLPL